MFQVREPIKERRRRNNWLFSVASRWHDRHAIATNQAIQQLISQLRLLRADDIIVLATNNVMPGIFEFTTSLAEVPAGVHIVPVEALNALASLQIAEFDDLQTIQVCQPPLSTFDLCFKRTFDIIYRPLD